MSIILEVAWPEAHRFLSFCVCATLNLFNAQRVGAEMKIAHVAEDKNPVVLGRLGREPGLPTIAFYGHYDVQVPLCLQ